MNTRIFAPLSALALAALLSRPLARGADPAPTEAPMRELGAVTPTPATAQRPTPTPTEAPTAAPTVTPTPTATPAPTSARHHHYHGVQDSDDDGNRVVVDSEAYVGANEVIPENAVAVFGPLTIDGTVNGNAVEIFGDGRIDGTVHGNVVAVMGSLHLGAHAHVDGNVVVVGGEVEKDEGAYTAHGIRTEEFAHLVPRHFRWFWIVGCLALYVLIAHMFPKGVEKCADTLAHRPGRTLLTGVIAVIALPIVWILLMITVVGIVLVPLAVFCTILYGRASINYLIGRPLAGKGSPAAMAALLGGVIVVLFYFIPIFGLLVLVILNFLAFAAAITTFLAPARDAVAVRPLPVPPVVPPTAPVPPVVPAASHGLAVPAAAATSAPAAPVTIEPPLTPPAFVPPVVPPPLPLDAVPPVAPVAPPPLVAPVLPVGPAGTPLVAAEYLLPRATFWIRMAALLVDLIIVAVVAHGEGALCLLALAGYGALMWKFKGTTLGGIIFGLKVVRVDGRPVDWPTAIVRALACFISLFVAGLGFIWIAVDPDRQAWHDRIAGTIVVKLPKSQPLV